MPTSNIPFSYAALEGNIIHLYLLVYAGTPAPAFSLDPELSGQTQKIDVTGLTSGTTPYFKYFRLLVEDPPGTIDTIEINCGTHIRKIMVSDFDKDVKPTTENEQAFEAPYSYTQKIDANHFSVEVIAFYKKPEKLKWVHSGPNNEKNTFSELVEDDTLVGATQIYSSHSFNVPAYAPSEGIHDGSDKKRRRSKTKNKNHSPTPFPDMRSGLKSSSARRRPKTEAASRKP